MITNSGSCGTAQPGEHLQGERKVTNHCVRPMNAPYQAIRIIDLDVGLTEPSHEGAGFRRLYLKLSEEPPPEWVKLFEQERRFPAHQVWRKAWVLGAHIVVECVPEELEQSQLNHLKEDVAAVNEKFLEFASTKKNEMRQELEEQAKARRDLENLRTRLSFD